MSRNLQCHGVWAMSQSLVTEFYQLLNYTLLMFWSSKATPRFMWMPTYGKIAMSMSREACL